MELPIIIHISDDGKPEFTAHNKLELMAAWGRNKGKDILLSITEKQDWKTHLQLGYWHGYVVPRARMGWIDLGVYRSKGDTHIKLMKELMYEPVLDERTKEPIVDKSTGEIEYKVRSMATMTKAEMMDLIPRMQQYCAENLYIVIEDPNKDWKNKK